MGKGGERKKEREGEKEIFRQVFLSTGSQNEASFLLYKEK